MANKKNLKALGRRGLSLFLALLMCVSMLNLTVFAAEEHTHNEDGWLCVQGESTKELTCGITEHTHGPECYTQTVATEPACGLEEGEGHTHTEDCYTTETVCDCGLEESEGHVHGDGCYTETKTEELICEEEERDPVYEVPSAGDNIYDADAEPVLVDPGHKHSSECYEVKTSRELTCGMEEGKGAHTHSESCMVEKEVLTCTESTEGHTHTADCYPVIEGELICEIPEHTHTDACYTVIPGEWTCEPPMGDGIMPIAVGGLPTSGTVNAGTYDLGGQPVKLTGSLKVTSGEVTIKNGTIDADHKGSAIIVSGSAKLVLNNVTIKNGTGTDVHDDDSDPDSLNGYTAILDYEDGRDTIKCGGGILLLGRSSLEMTGCTIKDNTAGFGGGIAAFRGTNVKVYGGCEITNNTSSTNGGGGMFLAGDNNVIDPTVGNADILIHDNRTNSTRDLGGGGVFVDSAGSMFVKNAMIYSNDANGMGGGVAGCLHGMVSIVDPDMAAIYENTAAGTSLQTATKRGFIDNSDWAGWSSITKSNSRDYLVAGYSLVGPQSLGGGFTKWQGVAVYRTNQSAGVNVDTFDGKAIEVDGILGLTVTNDAEVKKAAESNTAPKTKVYDNYSAMHGGGIGTNGLLKFGEETWTYSYSDTKITINAQKDVAVTAGASEQSLAGYTFELVKDGKTIATATTGADGKIEFKDILTSSLFGPGATSETTSVRATLTLREVTDSDHPGVLFDTKERTITINATRRVTEHHPTTEDGNNQNTVTLYKTVDNISSVTVSKEGVVVNNGATHTQNSVTLQSDANFTNEYKTGSIELKKVIKLDGEDPNEITTEFLKDAKFEFTVTGDNRGAKVNKTVTLDYGHDFAATLDNLPVGTYTITETGKGNVQHYTWDKVEMANDGSVTVTDGGKAEFTATNYYKLNRGPFTLQKVVELNDQQKNDSSLLEKIRFEFVLTGTSYDDQENHTFLIRLSKNNNWTFNTTNDMDDYGKSLGLQSIPAGEYTLYETSIPDVEYFNPGSVSYTVNGESVQMTGKGIPVVIENNEAKVEVIATNSYDVKKVSSLSITKDIKVNGEDLNEANKGYFENNDFNFKLELVTPADGFSTYSKDITIKKGETAKFENLPVGVYKLTETGTEITNYNFDGVTLSGGTVKKNDDGSFTIDLTDAKDGSTVSFTATNSYTVKESYFRIHKKVVLDGQELSDVTAKEDLAEAYFGFRVTGTDLNGKAQDLYINVKADGTVSTIKLPYGHYTVEEEKYSLDNYDHHTLTFTNSNGVTAEGEKAYVDLTENSLANGETIVVNAENTYTRKLADLSVTKIISGNNMNYGSVYDFTVALRAPADYVKLADKYSYTVVDKDGNPVEGKGSDIAPLPALDEEGNEFDNVQTVEINGETYTVYGTIAGLGNGETATVSDLPVGTMWHVVEVQENKGYTTGYANQNGIVAESAANSVTVTNSSSTDNDTMVNVQKSWEGDDANRRPTSITVQLYRDGVALEGYTKVLNAANGWRATWYGLTYGHRYSVAEVGTYPGYTATVTGEGSGTTVNIQITNTYDRNSDNTILTVNKVWVGDDEFVRPNSITVQLTKDGAADGAPVTLSAANGWTYTWTGLDENANYDVQELDVPAGYTVTKTQNGQSYTITNTYGGGDDEHFEEFEDNDVPLGGMPFEEIPEEDIPLADVPATGDDSLFWVLTAAVSAAGLAWLGLTKKREEEEA